MDRTMTNTSGDDAKRNDPEIEFFGDPDMWILWSKASSKSQKWMKTTKCLNVIGGVVIQTETQQGYWNGWDTAWSTSQSTVFVPGTFFDKETRTMKQGTYLYHVTPWEWVAIDDPRVLGDVGATQTVEISELTHEVNNQITNTEWRHDE